ncbi:MAG: hypothetical protein R3Y36_00805, partial [Spirochaetales bacterium]
KKDWSRRPTLKSRFCDFLRERPYNEKRDGYLFHSIFNIVYSGHFPLALGRTLSLIIHTICRAILVSNFSDTILVNNFSEH